MWRTPLVLSILAGALVGIGVLSLLVMWPRSAPRPAVVAPAVVTPTVVAPAARPAEKLEDVACWFPVPTGHDARCGVLTVPERWGSAQPSRSLHLRFVVFRGPAGAAADPIVYISGGPGEPSHIDAASIGFWWRWIDREDWLKRRDLVVFDQRGVGMSEPRMDCPEFAPAAYRVFGAALSLDESNAAWAAAAAACHKRLAGEGIDLASYNTEAIAADLKSLIAGLGYRSPILLATSYGTRVALRLAAERTLGVRAMILDSVDPPDAAEYVDGASGAARAFARLFAECADEPGCRAAFPDLPATFERLVRHAAAAPLTVDVPDPRGGQLAVRLDDAKLIEVLMYAFYDWRRIEELPAIIAALAAGDGRPLQPLLRSDLENYVAVGVSHGLFLSVECHDEFPFNPRDAVERGSARAPLFRKFAFSTLPLAVCAAWPVGRAAAAQHAPVASDVPILMLSGDLDPVTPPQWAAQAAKRLPHAFSIEFRGVGHGVLAAQACASRTVARFLADPTKAPTDDCLLAMGPPHFRKRLDASGPIDGGRRASTP